MSYPILTDEDIARLLTPAEAVAAMEEALVASEKGALVAPPRILMPAGEGELVFTVGAEIEKLRAAGFRVYGRYPGKLASGDQVVAVFDSGDGRLRGLVLGRLLGGLRTAALNAVAIQTLATPDARLLGVLGTGFQAHHHVRAALAVHSFSGVLIFSPTRVHRETFGETLAADHNLDVQVLDSAEQVVRSAEVLICATDAGRPVLEAHWLAPGAHVNGVGPKYKERHELPLSLAAASRVIATDSLQQIEAIGEQFYLAGGPHQDRMVALGSMLHRRIRERLPQEAITYFCSVGLAGTEVLLADLALKKARSAEQ